MPNYNPVSYSRQATAKVFIQPTGATRELDLGQCMSVSYPQSPQTTDVETSEKGFRQVARKLITKIEHSYEFTINEMTPEILELLNLGAASVDVVQASVTAPSGTISFTSVQMREVLDIGKRDVNTVVVKNSGNTVTYVEGVDYYLDAGAGYIQLIPGTTIALASTINVTFGCAALTRSKITALKKVFTDGNVRVVFFDQHSEIPIEEHAFNGQYRVTDRGQDDGTKLREVKLSVFARNQPVITYRKS